MILRLRIFTKSVCGNSRTYTRACQILFGLNKKKIPTIRRQQGFSLGFHLLARGSLRLFPQRSNAHTLLNFGQSDEVTIDPAREVQMLFSPTKDVGFSGGLLVQDNGRNLSTRFTLEIQAITRSSLLYESHVVGAKEFTKSCHVSETLKK